MPTRKQCEVFLVRYVPDVVKGEYINIGVVLRDSTGRFRDVKLTQDWRRVRCLDGYADVELLGELEGELRRALTSTAELDQVYLWQKLPDWVSNALQLTPLQGVYAEDPAAELVRIFELFCASGPQPGNRSMSGRHAIVNRMRDSFEKAGVWALMRKNIPVSEYTHKGDPLKLDCGYKPNGTVHLFHAVSLATDVNSAKVLAFGYPQIREGIARVEGAKTTLTAIVEDDLSRGDEAIGFALDMFERNNIIVASVAELPAIAEVARVELRV